MIDNEDRQTKVKAMKYQQFFFDSEYPKYTKYKLENWHIAYVRQVFNKLQVCRKDFFLDIGTGLGYLPIEAARKNIEISVGIDLSREGVKRASFFAKQLSGVAHGICDFVACSATKLPFRDKTFTKISSVAVFEHIADDDAAMDEMSRVASPGARALIVVPNTISRALPVLTLGRFKADKLLGHQREYKAETLLRELTRRGFSSFRHYYGGNLAKGLQYVLWSFFPRIRRMGSRIWWILEDLDEKLSSLPIGSTILVVVKKK